MIDPAEDAILRLVEQRGSEKSICPSEAARALAPEWRTQLKRVRAAAIRLAAEGRLIILRKGRKVEDFSDLRGVIRLRLPAPGAAGGEEVGNGRDGSDTE